MQDDSHYRSIYSVQDANDATLPILRAIEAESGSERITVVIDMVQTEANGKINNILGALPKAKHDILVISDSDTGLRPDYLKTLMSLLVNPWIGLPFYWPRCNREAS